MLELTDIWEPFFNPTTLERGLINGDYKLILSGPFHCQEDKREICEELANLLNGAL